MKGKRQHSLSLRNGAKMAAAVALSVAIVSGCSAEQKPEAAQSAEAQTVKTVKVQPITKQKIGEPPEQVADVVPAVQLDVIAKAGGEVTEIVKKRGDYVEEGEVIVRLDKTDMLLQKRKAELQLQSSQDALEKARQDLANSKTEMANSVKKMEQSLAEATKAYNKARNDYDQGLLTKAQLDQAETQWKNLTMDLELLKQKQKTLETTDSLSQLETQAELARVTLEEVERNLSNLDIKAPTSGVLTELPVTEGMTVQPGFKIGHIEKLDKVVIKAQLTEEAAKLVRGKKELTYYVPDENIKAKAPIKYLSDVVDAQSKSYDLELEVANSDLALKPGMKVQVQLAEEEEQIVVTVPTLSIVREDGETYVFVLVGDTVEKRKVELGRLNELNQEVLSGVKEGEQLVVSGQHQLKDKEKVQVAGTAAK